MMMMNDFGSPINDAEISMQPPGSVKPHEQMLAESGQEMNVFPWGAVIGAATGVLGGISANNQANAQAAAKNEYNKLKYDYDKENVDNANAKLDADWQYAYDTYNIRKSNEQKIADYTDAKNMRRYNYDLQIVKAQNESNKKAFQKSEFLYNQQLGFNNAAAASASQDAIIKQYEVIQDVAFQNEDAVLKSLEAEGKAMALVSAGGSKTKAIQALVYSAGANEQKLAETLISSDRNTKRTLETIARDKYGADLAAFAEKMLEPGVIPDPIMPLPTPVAEFQAPRALQDFDYAIDPIMGVAATGGGGLLSIASSTLGGIAKTADFGAWN